jgi:hypothetical protein
MLTPVATHPAHGDRGHDQAHGRHQHGGHPLRGHEGVALGGGGHGGHQLRCLSLGCSGRQGAWQVRARKRERESKRERKRERERRDLMGTHCWRSRPGRTPRSCREHRPCGRPPAATGPWPVAMEELPLAPRRTRRMAASSPCNPSPPFHPAGARRGQHQGGACVPHSGLATQGLLPPLARAVTTRMRTHASATLRRGAGLTAHGPPQRSRG